jgi:hypothetical protein
MPSLPLAAPERWASDDITSFIDAARVNEYATFANLPAQMSRLIGIDRSFRKVIDAFNNSKEWFPGLFILRAHSNFLGVCRLTLSGQLPESYALLRSTLENALYGLYLSRNPSSQETWLRREEDAKSKQKVRNEFKIAALLKFAAQIAPSEGKVAKTLYERAIDHGAHPNELALMQTLKLGKQPAHVKFTVSYLQGDGLQLQLALKTAAQVGVCTLALFERVLPERYAILGINQDIASLQSGL